MKFFFLGTSIFLMPLYGWAGQFESGMNALINGKSFANEELFLFLIYSKKDTHISNRNFHSDRENFFHHFFAIYKNAAELARSGNSAEEKLAFFNLGYLYENGWGTSKDKELARKYYEESDYVLHKYVNKYVRQNGNNDQTTFDMGMWLHTTDFNVHNSSSREQEMSARLLFCSINNMSDEMGRTIIKATHRKYAHKFFSSELMAKYLSAFENNNSSALACYNYGYLLCNERMKEKQLDGVRLIKLAADQGCPDAQTHLAVLLSSAGGIIDQDSIEASRLGKMAYDQGYNKAKFSLDLN